MDNEEMGILEIQAIDSALSLNWEKAISINKKMITKNKNSLEAYLRLGFAYCQTNKLDLAYKAYKKALRIQPTNRLAKRNLEKIGILKIKKNRKGKKNLLNLNPNTFLEVPGKTVTSSLVNVGQRNVLAQLDIGEKVFIKIKKRKVEIRTYENQYVGCLPDDLSKRLIYFIEAETKYVCFIKEASLTHVFVFIKEQKKGKKLAKYLSFPKDIQTNLSSIGLENENDNDKEDLLEDKTDDGYNQEEDIESLAKNLTDEDKIYLPYSKEITEDEEE